MEKQTQSTTNKSGGIVSAMLTMAALAGNNHTYHDTRYSTSLPVEHGHKKLAKKRKAQRKARKQNRRK